MNIAILGGTGDIGQGLALRWAADTTHTIRIGSRKEAKAKRAVAEYEELLIDRGLSAPISGHQNLAAARSASVVVLAVPPYYAADVAEEVLKELVSDAILVTPAVGMSKDEDGFSYDPPPAGSVTQHVRHAVPADIPVVGTFHNLPAGRLADLDADLGIDTLVIGDDPAAKTTVIGLADEIRGLRALDAGPMGNAPEIEAFAPLLINVATYNDGLHDLGVRFR